MLIYVSQLPQSQGGILIKYIRMLRSQRSTKWPAADLLAILDVKPT